jgi:Ankyrin repeats (3 copies)/Trehalose utilisation/Ankyrin repeat
MNAPGHLIILSLALSSLHAADKQILFIAGPKSHAKGEHEHPVGCDLLAAQLNTSGSGIRATVSQGWPQDPAAITGADSIVVYGDGLEDHPAKGRIADLTRHKSAGKGLAILHFALEPADPEMGAFFDQAIGGHFDPAVSVNPIWSMKSPVIIDHPAARGVKPFSIEEEFYFHIPLRQDAIALLTALPPESSLGADGPRSGNPSVRKALAEKTPQALAWVVENPDKSRGFGFTGGHFHRHWGNPDFRKLVLNSIAWTAHITIPETGVSGEPLAMTSYQTIDEAITKGDAADVSLHLKLNPESANKGGTAKSRPPLEQAILRNKTDIALILLENKADPNTTNASKRTPLHLAIERNNPTVVSALIKAGAKPDAGDKDGWTPLHHAAAKNQLETAKALLAGGANPMTLSALGGTPLHEAAASGGAEIIKLLLDHKVDPKIVSKQGVTALDLAKQYKNQPAIDALSGK